MMGIPKAQQRQIFPHLCQHWFPPLLTGGFKDGDYDSGPCSPQGHKAQLQYNQEENACFTLPAKVGAWLDLQPIRSLTNGRRRPSDSLRVQIQQHYVSDITKGWLLEL